MVKKSYVDPNHTPEVEFSTIRRILAWLRPYRLQAALVALAIVASTLVSLLPPLLVRRIVDGALPQRDLPLLAVLAIGMILASLAAGAIQVAQKYLATW